MVMAKTTKRREKPHKAFTLTPVEYRRLYKRDEEADVQALIIAELQRERELLASNTVSLLSALIDANDRLNGYRRQTLTNTQATLASIRTGEKRCAVGCDKHRWNDQTGWERT